MTVNDPSTPETAPDGPQERPEGGSATPAQPESLSGPQAGADGLGLWGVIAGAIWNTASTHPDGIADAVYAALQPHLAPHYQHAVNAAIAAERRARTAEAAVARVHALAERWRYTGDRKEGPLRELRQALVEQQPAPAPAAAQATNGACCGKPSGAVCVHDVVAPAHNTGPTIAEAAAQDRRWPLEKHGE